MTSVAVENHLSDIIEAKGASRKHSLLNLRKILKRLGLRLRANRLVICPFTKLPTEVIQQIVSYLPVASQAALALTNKTLLSITGTWAWKQLANSYYYIERIDFLLLLERDDCARYWLCRDCAVLHHKEAHFRKCPAFENGLINWWETNLRWAHIYLIMQRHFYGKDFGLPIEVLSENRIFPEAAFRSGCRQIIKHRKIIGDEVLIKARLIIDASFYAEDYTFIRVYGHLSSRPIIVFGHHKEFRELILCRLKHLRSAQKFCASCTPILRRCKYCAIEYDFPIRSLLKELKLEIDVWANLGSGRDRNDPKWSILNNSGFPEDQPLKYELGSIRAKYELGMVFSD